MNSKVRKYSLRYIIESGAHMHEIRDCTRSRFCVHVSREIERDYYVPQTHAVHYYLHVANMQQQQQHDALLTSSLLLLLLLLSAKGLGTVSARALSLSLCEAPFTRAEFDKVKVIAAACCPEYYARSL